MYKRKILITSMLLLFSFSLRAEKRSPIVATVLIESSAQKVWQALIDFENYGEWNEWVVKIEGHAKLGATVKAYAVSGDALLLKITKLQTFRRICWVDVTWFTHFGMGGYRCRSIQTNPNGAGVILTNYFEYSGIFAGFLDHYTRNLLTEGMLLENTNLKDFVERNPY